MLQIKLAPNPKSMDRIFCSGEKTRAKLGKLYEIYEIPYKFIRIGEIFSSFFSTTKKNLSIDY